MRKRLLFLTNIPAPYRLDFYNKLSAYLNTIEVDLHVIYLSKPYAHRSWKMGKEDYKHSYNILPDRYINIKNGMYIFHYNVGVAHQIEKLQPNVVVICGIFATPFLSTLFRLKKKCKVLLWTETNLASSTMKGGLMKKFKSFIYGKFDGYVIPGERSLDYNLWLNVDLKDKLTIRLPNLIQEYKENPENTSAVNHRENLVRKYNLNTKDQIWFVVSQLIKRKGVDIIIKNLKGLHNVNLFVAGDGPELNDLEAQSKLNDISVHFLGNCEPTQMKEMYQSADLFVLGSLRDPSPLSAIEALSFGLPICISDQIGNAPEVLENNRNGWSYNPTGNQTDISSLFEKIASKDVIELGEMGSRSKEIYEEVFSVQRNIKSFSDRLVELM